MTATAPSHETRLSELAATALRYRTLPEACAQVVWECDPKGRVLKELPSWSACTGMRFAEYRGLGWIDAVHPDDRAAVRAGWRAAQPTPHAFTTEARIRRHDGSYRAYSITAAPVIHPGEAGEPVVQEWVASCIGITERRRTERKQVERARNLSLAAAVGAAVTEEGGDSHALLERCAMAIVENLDAAFARVWTVNETEQVLELVASAGPQAQFGAPSGRVSVGAPGIGRIALERTPRFTNHAQHDDWLGDATLSRLDGIVAVAACPLIIEKQTIGVLALAARRALSRETFRTLGIVANGIALALQRARVEQALRLGEQALREETLIVETLRHIGESLTTELELEKVVQAVTDAATSLTGAQFGSFFYNALDDAGESYMLHAPAGAPREAFAPSPMPRNTPLFNRTFRGMGIVRSVDITRDARYGQNPRFDGQPKGHLPVVSYLAVPVVSHTGAVLGGLFFGHERAGVFTEREERLVVGIASWAAVAMDNARLYQAERRARTEAEEANRAKSEFLAAMSHELRTPLNVIAGHVQLMEMGIHGPVTDAQREALTRVQRSERHLLSLINDVLNFAKLQAGHVEYAVEDVPLLDLVADVVSMVQPQLADKRLAFSFDIAPGIMVRVDQEKLRQILLNLLGNAVKFTNTGGRVSVDTGARDGTPPEVVYVRVSDNGCGLSREKHEAVFDPFVQVPSRVIRTREGTGLGLAISRDLARGMGGDLRVRSEEGRGATFTLTLPRSPAQPRAGAA